MLRKNEIVSYDLSAGHIYMRRNGHDVIMTIDSLDTQSILLLELIEQITNLNWRLNSLIIEQARRV